MINNTNNVDVRKGSKNYMFHCLQRAVIYFCFFAATVMFAKALTNRAILTGTPEANSLKAGQLRPDATGNSCGEFSYTPTSNGPRILLNETLEYRARVVSSGGSVVDINSVDADIRFLKSLNAAARETVWDLVGFWGCARAGMKVSGGKIERLYDVRHNTNNHYDYIQTEPNRQPSLVGKDIYFDGVNDCLYGRDEALDICRNIGMVNIFAIEQIPVVDSRIQTLWYSTVGNPDDVYASRCELMINQNNYFALGGVQT